MRTSSQRYKKKSRRAIYIRQLSYQPLTSETEMVATRDDNMVQKTYVEEARSLLDTLGELPILLTRRRVTRGVVVYKDNLHSKTLQGTLQYKPTIDDCSLNTALTDTHTFEHPTR